MAIESLMLIFWGTIFKTMPCKECLECKLELVEDDTTRMGSASCLSLTCSSCGYSQEFYTSKKAGHCFEVNRRMVYGMRSIGCGLSGMKKFCSTMDMPPPVNPRAYSYHTKAILRATKGTPCDTDSKTCVCHPKH